MQTDHPPQSAVDRAAEKSFVVVIGDIEGSFQEVHGLQNDSKPMEYRSGDSARFSPAKMEGLTKPGKIHLKNGLLKSRINSSDLHKQLTENMFEKRDIHLTLVDEFNNKVMTWKLVNAMPLKYSGPDMNATGNDTPIDSLELTHEGIVVVEDKDED